MRGKASIQHISEHNFAYAIKHDTLNIRLKVENIFDKVVIYYKNVYDHSMKIKKKAMDIILTDDVFALYETFIQVKERHFKYYFELHLGNEVFYYTADGLVLKAIPSNYFYYSMINQNDILVLPKWAEGKIIYQILVDRFFDGNPLNNPPHVKDISKLPDQNTYYGGDFEGIIEKLPYIASLGTKIIYLSPVFKSPTYHKYDIYDYETIEEIYGGEKQLKNLIDKAHQMKMKVILDAVFNHASIKHPFFQDVIEKGEKSIYHNWFWIESFPVNLEKCNYDTFASLVPSMPKWNTTNPEVIDYLVKISEKWVKKLSIDGWRLDVADEVATVFWQAFRSAMKAINPDIIIIGEVWNNATKWMQGDQMDTITNYKYRYWLINFLTTSLDSDTFWNKLNANKMLYKTPMHNYLVNLIGSHDTIRSLTYLKDKKIHFLALALMLTMDGMPLIYYGDEIGMEGDVDPDNRRAFQWNKINQEELKFIQTIGMLRSQSEVLQKGQIIPIKTKGKVIAFKRVLNKQSITVIVNFSKNIYKQKGTAKSLIFGNGSFQNNHLIVKPYSIAIFNN